jgi:hypothetical protein
MPEQIDQCCEALFAVSIDIKTGIIEEASAGSQADAAVAHVA